jgi:tRNA(Ile)-lysidine synthase
LVLPGGATVVRRGSVFEVRSAPVSQAQSGQRLLSARPLTPGATLHWGTWRFTPLSAEPPDVGETPALDLVAVPRDAQVIVRRWEAGDRIRLPDSTSNRGSSGGAWRRISRYLAEAGIPRLDRSGWPVVMLHDDIIWVPHVCRGLPAPHRSGRSDLIWYRSEREFG